MCLDPGKESGGSSIFQCPVYTGDMKKADNMAYSTHQFCFGFTLRWARGRDDADLEVTCEGKHHSGQLRGFAS